jgi:hypothetical protein
MLRRFKKSIESKEEKEDDFISYHVREVRTTHMLPCSIADRPSPIVRPIDGRILFHVRQTHCRHPRCIRVCYFKRVRSFVVAMI